MDTLSLLAGTGLRRAYRVFGSQRTASRGGGEREQFLSEAFSAVFLQEV